MNSFNQTRSFPKGLLLTAVFMLAMVCLSANEAMAQAQGGTYNWKSTEEAIHTLQSQVAVLNQQMPGLAVGTPLYDNTLRRVAYFKAIAVEIGKGATIAEALELSLPAAATLGFEKEASYTPKVLLKALQTETRVLLTN